MAATKKSIGDSSCPPHTRRVKQISRDVCGQAHAEVVDYSSEDGEDDQYEDKGDSRQRM